MAKTVADLLPLERQARIMELLDRHSRVVVSELSELFGVSEVTIRQDLARLEEQGLLARTRGGGILNRLAQTEGSFMARYNRNREQKEAIARRAAQLVVDDDYIVLDASTTVLYMAKQLAGKRSLTALCMGIKTAEALVGLPDVTVNVVGGTIRERTLSTVGPLATENLSRFKGERVFLSVEGVTAQEGLSVTSMLEAEIKRALIAAGKEVILLVDASKIGRVTFAQVSPIAAVHRLLTNDGACPQEVERLRQLGVDVTLC